MRELNSGWIVLHAAALICIVVMSEEPGNVQTADSFCLKKRGNMVRSGFVIIVRPFLIFSQDFQMMVNVGLALNVVTSIASAKII